MDYLPFAETLIFICFGLDSSRFARCRVKTPLRYSARMFSELTVLGSLPGGLTEIQTNEVGSSSHRLHAVQLAVCCAKQGFNRFAVLGIRRPRRCSRKAGVGDYPWLVGYEYVMRQALRPPTLSRAG